MSLVPFPRSLNVCKLIVPVSLVPLESLNVRAPKLSSLDLALNDRSNSYFYPMHSIVKMSRPGNIFIALLTLIVGCAVSGGNVSSAILAADMFAFAFAIAFGNVLNDIFDVSIDRISHPERPLPSGKISVFAALSFCGASLVLAFVPAAFPSVRTVFHIAFYAMLFALLFLYDRFFKRIPLLKNITVAALCTTPLIRAAFYPEANSRPLFVAIGFAFLLTLVREILKDLEDMDGDRHARIATFPILAGKFPAQILASSLLLLVFFCLPLPVFLFWLPGNFLLFSIPFFPFCLCIFRETARGNFRKAQKLTKAAMLAGLIALIATSL